MTSILTRKHFGLPSDPWSRLNLETTDAACATEMILAAVDEKLMISLLGPRGSGKTRALRTALQGLDVKEVEPLRLDRERLHLGDIETAIVQALSHESPKRSGEARSHQVRKVLGEASRRHPVLLVLDDSHLLHHNTLRGLKRLRELSWTNESPLLGIVLLGQSDRAKEVPEVGLRSDTLTFVGLTQEEASEALVQALNQQRLLAEPEVVEGLAACSRARNWLDLQALADDCLAEAAARGEETITTAAVRVVLGGDRRPDPAPQAPTGSGDAAVTSFLQKKRARKSA